MDFKRKVVIVTGASTGIGRATALAFAKKKAIVVLVSRNQKNLDSALAEVKRYSQDSMAISCDVSNYSRVKKMVSDVVDQFNKVDILINNAGFGEHISFEDSSMEYLHEVMDTNYFGILYCTKEILPFMKKNKSGNIVNISSVIGKFAVPNMSGYVASKFAVVGFSESLAHELKPFNVNVHLVFPGVTRTNFFDSDSFPDSYSSGGDSPEMVANTILSAIERNKFDNFVRFRSKLIFILSTTLPSLFRYLIRRRA